MTSLSLKLLDEGLARKPLKFGASITNIAARFAAVAAATASAQEMASRILNPAAA